jgi:DNA-binding MarR family transcriptional regulator
MYMHINMQNATKTTAGSRNSPPLLPCACANLRRAARAVTRLYNHELRSENIEITQFTLLMALHRAGEVSQGTLGKILALDSTTLTRMLELVEKRGWVREKEGEDRRFRIIGLTPAGRSKLQRGLPHWKRAQERLQGALGEQALGQLVELLGQVTTWSAS